MKYKPYPAFGAIVILCNAEVGDTRKVALGENGLVSSGYYYYTDGIVNVKVSETGEELEDRTAGWLKVEHAGAGAATSGNLDLTFPVSTEWLCIPLAYNKRNGLPTLTSLVVKSHESVSLPKGTDLFLVRGQLQINDKQFIGPCQIRVRSSDAIANSTYSNASYGLIFS